MNFSFCCSTNGNSIVLSLDSFEYIVMFFNLLLYFFILKAFSTFILHPYFVVDGFFPLFLVLSCSLLSFLQCALSTNCGRKSFTLMIKQNLCICSKVESQKTFHWVFLLLWVNWKRIRLEWYRHKQIQSNLWKKSEAKNWMQKKGKV